MYFRCTNIIKIFKNNRHFIIKNITFSLYFAPAQKTQTTDFQSFTTIINVITARKKP